MACVMLTVKKAGGGTHKVCLAVPGNKQVMAEAKAGKLRKPVDYSDREIATALQHHMGKAHRHGK